MLQKMRQRMGREEGFTLVELLVVMLILGILAAIAIPSFFNQRNKAHDADAKSDARAAQTAIETYATDHSGSYVGADGAALHAIESTVPASVDVPTATATTYKVTATSSTTNTFSISRAADGSTSLTCTPVTTDGKDGCAAGGTWGG